MDLAARLLLHRSVCSVPEITLELGSERWTVLLLQAPPSQSLSHLDRQVPKSKSQTIRNSDPSFLWRTDTRLQLASQASGEVRLNCGSPLCYAGPTGLHCTALSLLELESIREIQRSSPWFACQVPGLARPYSGVHRPMVLLFIALSGQQHKARSCHCLRCRHTIFQQYTTENIQIPAESYQAKC